mmetsp:Transcript_15376/g.17956  ORF Transcript_15376/g.17956 Transcript_15376/m.17956 type:complete len:362 (+) Transcript_15376:182-1267(+)
MGIPVWPVVLSLIFLWWTQRAPRFDWEPKAPETYPHCRKDATSQTLLFGGTSMLGGYIVDTWKKGEPKTCLVNYGRRPCPKCDISLIGDVRDSAHIARVFEHYKFDTVVTSIKPALEGTHWREFMEINAGAMIELTRLAKEAGVKNFIHVSSIAASSHYKISHMENEDHPQPLYTEYEAAYDLSKRLGEDYVLAQHEQGKFNTIALRVSGIIGGEGDPFFHHRMFPILFTFNNPVIVDYGFAGNIADALFEMTKVIREKPSVGGQFYYYTGEHIFENETAIALSEFTGKPLLTFPAWTLDPFLDLWQWIRTDHNTYTILDLMRCGNVEQTFDQTKFHNTFPNFKPKFTVIEALEYLYANNK